MSRRDGEEQGKIFVGGLSWETTEDGLRQYFCTYGDVMDCVVMCNKETGRSRGFGFVTFRDPSSVALVLAGAPHTLDGRTIDPKACNPRGFSNGPSRNDIGKGMKKGNPCKIFLGGLPATVTEEELCEFFSQYGKVIEAVIMFDHEQQRSRGFGFLVFDNEDAVSKLTQQRFVQIKEKQVECKRAEPRNVRPPMKRGWGGGEGAPPMGGGPHQGWGASGGPPPPPPMNGAPMPPSYQGSWSTPPVPPPATGYPGYQQWGAPAGGSFGSYPTVPPAAPAGNSQMYSGFGTYNQAASSYGPVRGSAAPAAPYSGSYNTTGYADSTAATPSAPADASKTGSQPYTYHPYQR